MFVNLSVMRWVANIDFYTSKTQYFVKFELREDLNHEEDECGEGAGPIGDRIRLCEYEVDESDLSAETVAKKVNLPPEQVFKTLVARGDKAGVFLSCVPGNAELDLKAIAALSGNKKVELVAVKEIQQLTGYIRRGGVPDRYREAVSCLHG